MKNMRIFIFVIIVILFSTSVGCDLIGIGNNLIGTWRWEYGTTWEEITLKSDDSFTVSGYSSLLGSYVVTGTYTSTSSSITLSYSSGVDSTMEYELVNDILKLTSSGLTWDYVKQ